MLIRNELTEPSIRTFSFSFLLMTTGVSSNSLLVLQYNTDRHTLHDTHDTYTSCQYNLKNAVEFLH